MKQRILSVFLIGGLILIILILCINIFGGDDKTADIEDTTSVPTVTVPISDAADTTTSVPFTEAITSPPTTEPVVENTMPQTTQEIIDKYSELVNAFKSERPAYKKKEYQVLPEEYRNFGTAINFILNLASGYMVTEEECEELVRPAGSDDILYDMPIHNTDKGCVLTEYDAVTWAKCEDLGDGTYKISFSLKEEVNAEPTPAESLIPVSAHGAVMQPAAMTDIITEVRNITSSVPGINLNEFALYYRECEFSCIYDPQMNKVLSITHHIVIDISADVEIIASEINGTARLLNEMFIYDITW